MDGLTRPVASFPYRGRAAAHQRVEPAGAGLPRRDGRPSSAWRGWRRRQGSLIGISTDDYRDRAGLLKLSNATISHFIDHRLELEHMLRRAGADRSPGLIDRDGRVREEGVHARVGQRGISGP